MNVAETYDGDFVFGINIMLGRASLRMTSGDTDCITLNIDDGDREESDMKITFAEGMLNVEQNPLSLLKPDTAWQVEVMVPPDWKGACDLRTVQGSLHAEGISGTDILLSTVKGSITAQRMSAIEMTLRSRSGAICCDKLQGDELILRTGRGAAELTGVRCEGMNIRSRTGDVQITAETPYADVKAFTMTADVALSAPVERADALLRTVKGRILTDDVSITEDGPTVRAKTLTGSLRLNMRQG